MRAPSLLLLLLAACGGASETTSGAAPARSPGTESAPSGTSGGCRSELMEAAQREGGLCLRPDVLGEAELSACRTTLEQRGWTRDPAAEETIGRETGTRVICVHAPAPSDSQPQQ